MSITTTTHLNFAGDARAALEFYQSVFGGQTTVASYGDFGMPAELPGADRVVFGQLESADGFRVMAYDVPVGSPEPHRGSTRRDGGVTHSDESCFVSVRGDSLSEVQGYWAGLSEDASIVEEFAASAWSPGFGMLTDRFGVTWILDVVTPTSAA